MINNRTPLRPAMTALAAVIALSSTPLFAQTVESPAAADAPVIAAPPPPEVSAPAASLATPAPEAAPAVTTPAPEPVAAMRTQSTPVVHTGEDNSVDSTPVRTRVATAAPTRTATTTTTTTKIAAAPTPVAALPLAATPAPAPLPVERVAPEPAAPVATAQTVTTRTVDTDRTAEVGALAAAGLLAAGGLAYGLSRRRRREDEIVDETVYAPETVYDTPFDGVSPLAAPAIPLVAAAPAAPAFAAAGASNLPNGFDLSRFGPHVQAAYRGPTPDNPSFSLRRRLHRAAFFDQRAREAEAAGIAPPIPTPIAARNAASDDQIVVNVGKQRAGRFFGLGGSGLATQH